MEHLMVLLLKQKEKLFCVKDVCLIKEMALT